MSPNGQPDRSRLRRQLGVVAVLVLVAVLAWSTNREDLAAVPTTTLAPIVTPTSVELSTTTTGSSSGSTAAAPTMTTTVPSAFSDLVPGIAGTVHVLVGGGSNRELIDLPADPEETLLRPVSTLPGSAGGLSFDVANRLLAFRTTEPSDDTERLNVWSSTATYQLDGLKVADYQWHQSQPGRLAVITVANGLAVLRTIAFETTDLVSPAITTITEVDSDHSLIAWGKYGFIITDYDLLLEADVTTLLDQAGTIIWQSQNMTVLDASPTHLLVLRRLPDQEGYEHGVIEPSDPEASLRLDLPLDGTPTGTDWSPDGQLAVHYPIGGHDWNLRIFEPEFSDYTDVMVQGWRVWDLEWGPDSRYLLMPGTNDDGRHVVVFYDTTAQTLSLVDFPTWVQWADLS